MIENLDLRGVTPRGKLSAVDTEELRTVHASDLDGAAWQDVARVSRVDGGSYRVVETATGRVLSRHSLLCDALAEARRIAREQWR